MKKVKVKLSFEQLRAVYATLMLSDGLFALKYTLLDYHLICLLMRDFTASLKPKVEARRKNYTISFTPVYAIALTGAYKYKMLSPPGVNEAVVIMELVNNLNQQLA